MNYIQAVKIFMDTYTDLWEEEVDYWTAQECWANFTDILCKEGSITQKQYERWETPFTYGKRLSIRKIYSR